MAFDFGLSQIGIATGNAMTGMASELDTVNAKQGVPQWQKIEQHLKDWSPNLCLVGLPINMDGSESELSSKARKFANQLHGRFGVQIEMVDERLSSFEAKSRAKEEGHKGDYKAAPIDALAAKILVEQWLENNP